MNTNLLARVASYYYHDELTQSEIAARLGISRVKVYRLLKEARAEGIVQITINWPTSRDLGLEQRLRELFDLRVRLVAVFERAADERVGELAHGHFFGGGGGQFDFLPPGGVALVLGERGGLLGTPEMIQRLVEIFRRIQVVLK